MEVKVYNTSGQETGRTVTLPDSIFGIEPKEHAIYLDVKHYLASQRQGTHKAKNRNEVKGSSRKIKKQKGTGTARAGNIRNPLYRGGGRMFGPQPRDYSFKLNHKIKKLARRSALAAKAQQGNVIVLEDFSFNAPKTKEFVAIAKNLKIADKKSLWMLPANNKNVYLSARNIPNAEVIEASLANTYTIMNANTLVICEGSLPLIEKVANK